MNFRQQVTSIGFGLVTVFILGCGAYFLFAACVDKLNTINSDLGKALIAGGLALVGSSIALVGGKLLEQRIKIRQEVRDRKVPVYEQQIAALFQTMFAAKRGEIQSAQSELEKAFLAFTEKLLIWGSSEVIQAWQAFRNHDWQNKSELVTGFLLLESFIKTLRTEIGNENSQLKDGDLLRLFINDFETLEVRQASTEPS